jgi:hypothetical protein
LPGFSNVKENASSRIHNMGLENAFRAHPIVKNVVAIFPGYFCARRNRDGLRAEVEVINFHFAGARCALRRRLIG